MRHFHELLLNSYIEYLVCMVTSAAKSEFKLSRCMPKVQSSML